MREFLSLAVSGAVSGALYAIVASGLVLTYQTSGILNFAHGAVAFVCAFLFYELHQPPADGGLGLPLVLAAILTVGLFAPVLGWFLDRVMLRRLAGAPETARVVGTVGLLVAMPSLAIFVVERLNAVFDAQLPTNEQVFSPPGLGPRPKDSWSVSEGVVIDSDQVAVFLAAALAAVGLWFVLRRTRLGLEMRAGVDRAPLAQLRGVDTDRVGAISWMLSFLLAGLAGVLIAPLFDLEPFTYNLIVFAAFTAVVFAGMRSIPLAFAGGLLLGVVQNLVYGYAPDFLVDISGFRSVLPYLLLLLLLLLAVRGRSVGVARSASEERPPPDPRAGLTAMQRRMPWALATGALAVYVWFAADDFWASLTARGLALGLVFLSFVVVTGIGGMISLAQAAFVTTGAFTAGWLVNHQWPQTMPVLMNDGRMAFGVAALAAAVVAAAVGVVVALPSLRLGGLALALATLALAFIGDRLVFQVEAVRNGSSGWSVPAPRIGSLDFGEPRPMATLLLGLCLLVAFAITNLVGSSSGRAMLAVRSTDVAARTAGISPVGTKLALFAISAGIAGFGGAMYAAVTSPFTNTTSPAVAGVFWLAVTVTFGVRRAAGAVLAGLAVAMAPSAIDWLTSSAFAWRVVFLLAAAVVAGFVLGTVLGRMAPEAFAAHGERASTVASMAALGSLLVAALGSSNAFLYVALLAVGLLLGLPAGAGFAARPTARAPIGLLVVAGALAAPQLVTWFAGATTAADAVNDAIGSTHLPSILFGLGAIALATNPDGILAMTSEQRRTRRQARERARLVAVPATPASVPSSGPAGDGPTPPVLRVEDLVAGWGDVEVLHGVGLDVPPGAIVALLGANGAGKSTLCSVIGGTVPVRRGRIVLDGVDVTREPAFRRARSGLMLLPESRGIFPGLSVAENLDIWLPDTTERDRAYGRFPLLGDRRGQLAGNLSGGEQQMLALVSALERPPRVLVADEPTLGLAPLAVESVFQALVELRDRGVGLLLVEEKARDVVDVADTVTLVELGRVRWSGPREDADPDRLAAVYLGT